MKKICIMFIALCISSCCAMPVFAIETDYKQTGYYQTFINDYIARQQQKGMMVQSRDGKRAARVPEPKKQEQVKQQTIIKDDGNENIPADN